MADLQVCFGLRECIEAWLTVLCKPFEVAKNSPLMTDTVTVTPLLELANLVGSCLGASLSLRDFKIIISFFGSIRHR